MVETHPVDEARRGGDTRLGRLTRRREFLAAAKGARHHGRLMTLQALARAPDTAGAGLRAGLTVTRKVGTATERNRIRRRLRAALRTAASTDRDAPVDLVVVGRREILSARFADLTAEVGASLSAVLGKARRHAAAAPRTAPLASASGKADLPKTRGRTVQPAATPSCTTMPRSEPPAT